MSQKFVNKNNLAYYNNKLKEGAVVVGLSDNFSTKLKLENSTPYLFRTTAVGEEVASASKLEALVGGDVIMNQQIADPTFTDAANWTLPDASYGSISVANNIATVTVTAEGAAVNGLSFRPTTGVIGTTDHIYLYDILVNRSVAGKIRFQSQTYLVNNSDSACIVELEEDTWTHVRFLAKATSTHAIGTIYISMIYTGSGPLSENGTIQFQNYNIFDLTKMFGKQIADYLFSLETNEAVNQLYPKGFFTKPAYTKDAVGTFLPVNASSKITIGFNQWDEQYESGALNPTTGAAAVDANSIRSTNYIKVIPGMEYYFKSANAIYPFYYDAAKNYLGYSDTDAKNDTRTLPEECYYIKFYCATTTLAEEDICISIYWDNSREEDYEPYTAHTYALDDSVSLHGILKLDSGNNIYYDGDEYASNGTVTRKFEYVDLGDLNWYKKTDGTYPYFVSDPSNALYSGTAGRTDLIRTNAPYEVVGAMGASTFRNSNHDGQITVITNLGSTRTVAIMDSAYDNSDANTFKNSLIGKKLIYRLATPTEEAADAFDENQVCDNWGTEQFVDTRSTPMPVGHTTIYLPDLKAKVESMPGNPESDGTYVMTRENDENNYTLLSTYLNTNGYTPNYIPAPPAGDGTYTLKVTVADGTPTYSWDNGINED